MGRHLPAERDGGLIISTGLPTNRWKFEGLSKTKEGSHGGIRELELVTAAKCRISCPVSLPIPLVIQEEPMTSTEPVAPKTACTL